MNLIEYYINIPLVIFNGFQKSRIKLALQYIVGGNM